ncbi:ATP-binding protein [Haloarcula sp. S1CR25-12]|uniref:histidine kinase n=1 Tax=Haloarcula saliterrae TaxID=2950534 RepID=A0ABU2FBA7_9EURY|nr:histidine kinase N-terminal 7TM domain-containing protein [Haloarcula sp. S1CR25-12]MDS0258995.1 ATP-binding protein [Haloarcula sp. S1CR25-12]
MAYQLPLVSVVMFAATVPMVASAAVAWRHRAVPGATAFVAFVCCGALWAGSYGGQLLFTSLEAQLLWTYPQYPGGLFTSLAFGVFALHYTGRDHYLTRSRLVALLIIPVLTSVLVWIPSLRWLVRQDATMVTVSSYVVADIERGPLFHVSVAYCYLVVLGGLGLLGLTAVRTRRLYQKQTVLITAAAVVPLVGGAVAYLFDFTVIDYTPVGLSVFGVGVAVALTRYRLLDVSPVPRNRVIDRVDTGIVVTDDRDRVVDINPAATRVVGSTDVIGQRLGRIGDVAAEMASMADGTTAELRLEDDDDATYFECTRSTLAAEGGFGDTHLYILTEVTARRRREQALEAKNDRLDSFAEVLSHDLRNPLSVAAGSTELAREEPAPEHFDRVEQAHERMDEIIGNMLTLARSGQTVADPDTVDLATVARESWSHVSTEDAVLTVEGTADITADPKRLGQLFENLFRNCVEHGSTSSRTASDDAVEHGSAGSRPESDHTEPGVSVRVGTTESGFFVADDGPGIPEDEREEIFTPGVSSAADGTGVGLAIVRTVADGHEWSVTVTESAAGGARFDIDV